MRKSDKRAFEWAHLWTSYVVHLVEGWKLIADGFLMYLGNSGKWETTTTSYKGKHQVAQTHSLKCVHGKPFGFCRHDVFAPCEAVHTAQTVRTRVGIVLGVTVHQESGGRQSGKQLPFEQASKGRYRRPAEESSDQSTGCRLGSQHCEGKPHPHSTLLASDVTFNLTAYVILKRI